MDKPLFSENWYRVKALRPKLRAHTRVKRHDYRGSIWYLLADEASSRFHRFNGQAYQVIGLMDGRRTVHQIWERVNTLLGDDAPVQDDIIYLLGQLHQMDALQTDIAPDIEELFQRGEEHQRKQLQARLRNPLALRVGLLDLGVDDVDLGTVVLRHRLAQFADHLLAQRRPLQVLQAQVA
ncbi:MAG: hypothetical protein R3228_17170, partial [Halioglobus sp.]|nr:hypothetical protein [Halioglobus sp.]